jgi:hypothetical protein
VSAGTFGGDLADFLAKDEDDVKRALQRFMLKHPEVDPRTRAIIVIDVERPHLKDLHTYSPSEQAAIVKAFRVRIAATKALFPNAKLALYGTSSPFCTSGSAATTS